MKTIDFNIIRATLLLSRLKGDAKITVGELAKWTGASKSSARRSVEKLVKNGALGFTEFNKGKLVCRSYHLTPSIGLPIAQELRQLWEGTL